MKIYVTQAGGCRSVAMMDDDESSVIDGGATDALSCVLSERLTPADLLALHRVRHVVYLVCTMPDAEHLAGLYEIARTAAVDFFVIGSNMLEWLEALERRRDINPRGKETVRIFRQLQAALSREGVEILEVSPTKLHLDTSAYAIDCAEDETEDGVPCLAVMVSWDEGQLTLGPAAESSGAFD